MQKKAWGKYRKALYLILFKAMKYSNTEIIALVVTFSQFCIIWESSFLKECYFCVILLILFNYILKKKTFQVQASFLNL